MVKVAFLFVMLLIAISCEGKKKKKKNSSGFKPSWLQGVRTPPPKKTNPPSTTVGPTTIQVRLNGGFDITALNSTDDFYRITNLPRLPQHKKGNSHGSSAFCGTYLEGACAPRPTFVPYPDPPFGSYHYPSGLLLNLCSGFCFFPAVHCKPVGVERTSSEVYKLSLGGFSGSMSARSGIQMSYTKEVKYHEQHKSCECACIKTPDMCNTSTQYWDSGSCDCRCKPKYQNLQCTHPFRYEPSECKCVCARVAESCKDQHKNKKWSDADCACVCDNVHRCPRHQTFNHAICQCQLVGK